MSDTSVDMVPTGHSFSQKRRRRHHCRLQSVPRSCPGLHWQTWSFRQQIPAPVNHPVPSAVAQQSQKQSRRMVMASPSETTSTSPVAAGSWLAGCVESCKGVDIAPAVSPHSAQTAEMEMGTGWRVFD